MPLPSLREGMLWQLPKKEQEASLRDALKHFAAKYGTPTVVYVHAPIELELGGIEIRTDSRGWLKAACWVGAELTSGSKANDALA